MIIKIRAGDLAGTCRGLGGSKWTPGRGRAFGLHARVLRPIDLSSAGPSLRQWKPQRLGEIEEISTYHLSSAAKGPRWVSAAGWRGRLYPRGLGRPGSPCGRSQLRSIREISICYMTPTFPFSRTTLSELFVWTSRVLY